MVWITVVFKLVNFFNLFDVGVNDRVVIIKPLSYPVAISDQSTDSYRYLFSIYIFFFTL